MNTVDFREAAKKGKHIFIPKKDAHAILSILNSGKVKQGKGALFNGTGYCCLGVMQCYKSGGKVEVRRGTASRPMGRRSIGYPSHKWLKKVGWTFTGSSGEPNNNPYLPALKMRAASANDRGISFKMIAAAMENAIQYTD